MMLVTVHKEGQFVWSSLFCPQASCPTNYVLIADTNAPDALVSRRGVIVEIMGHGAISPQPLVSF